MLPKDNGRIIKGTGHKTEKGTKRMKKYGATSMQEMLKQKTALQPGTEMTKRNYD